MLRPWSAWCQSLPDLRNSWMNQDGLCVSSTHLPSFECGQSNLVRGQTLEAPSKVDIDLDNPREDIAKEDTVS